MSEQAGPIQGHCLCGAVTVRATPVRSEVEACHCGTCRRWSGSAFLGVQCGTEVEIAGDAQLVRYRSSEWAERGFCAQCGSHIYFRFLPADTYSFLAGLFPDSALHALSDEIFIDEKPDYYAFAGERTRLTGAEIMAKAKADGFDFGA